MFSISKTFQFCYGHRLVGDTGRCKNLHGHTAKVEITVCSEKTDECGMVLHFDRLKETIGKWISENLDHTMLLCKNDPAAKLLMLAGEKVFLVDDNPTAENIAKIIFFRSKEMGIPVSTVEVWESDTSKARFSACD